MEILESVLTITQVIVGLIVMILVLLQDSKEDGNIVTGAGNKGGAMGESADSKLVTWTKIFGIIYIILTIAAGSIMLINR